METGIAYIYNQYHYCNGNFLLSYFTFTYKTQTYHDYLFKGYPIRLQVQRTCFANYNIGVYCFFIYNCESSTRLTNKRG